MGRRSDREEYAVITFIKPGLAQQWTEGSRPREMEIVVPALDKNDFPIPMKGACIEIIPNSLLWGKKYIRKIVAI